MNKNELKQEIIKYGKKLGAKNMTPGTSGNISVRYGSNLLISASGTCLADLQENEIVEIDSNCNVVDSDRKASSEKKVTPL